MKMLCWSNDDYETKTNEIVSIRQILSFAKHRSTQVCVLIAVVCAVISGLVYPGRFKCFKHDEWSIIGYKILQSLPFSGYVLPRLSDSHAPSLFLSRSLHSPGLLFYGGLWQSFSIHIFVEF